MDNLIGEGLGWGVGLVSAGVWARVGRGLLENLLEEFGILGPVVLNGVW
jgi:hypothetical protein